VVGVGSGAAGRGGSLEPVAASAHNKKIVSAFPLNFEEPV
jgi:hypothetical protein